MSRLVTYASIGRLFTAGDDGTIEGAAMAVRDGVIVYAGPETGLSPALGPNWQDGEVVDLGGALVTPGLVLSLIHI